MNAFTPGLTVLLNLKRHDFYDFLLLLGKSFGQNCRFRLVIYSCLTTDANRLRLCYVTLLQDHSPPLFVVGMPTPLTLSKLNLVYTV